MEKGRFQQIAREENCRVRSGLDRFPRDGIARKPDLNVVDGETKAPWRIREYEIGGGVSSRRSTCKYDCSSVEARQSPGFRQRAKYDLRCGLVNFAKREKVGPPTTMLNTALA